MPDELKVMAGKGLLDNMLSTAQSALAVGAGAVFLYRNGGRKFLSEASGISSRVLGGVKLDLSEIEERKLCLTSTPESFYNSIQSGVFSTETTDGNTIKLVEEAIEFAIWFLNKVREVKQGNVRVLNELNISKPIRTYQNNTTYNITETMNMAHRMMYLLSAMMRPYSVLHARDKNYRPTTGSALKQATKQKMYAYGVAPILSQKDQIIHSVYSETTPESLRKSDFSADYNEIPHNNVDEAYRPNDFIHNNKMILPMDIVCDLNNKEKWKAVVKKGAAAGRSNIENAAPTNLITPLLSGVANTMTSDTEKIGILGFLKDEKELKPYLMNDKIAEETTWGSILNTTVDEPIIPLKRIHTNHQDESLVDSKLLIEAENQAIFEKAQNQGNKQQVRFKDRAIENPRFINDELTLSERILSNFEEHSNYSGVTYPGDVSPSNPLISGSFFGIIGLSIENSGDSEIGIGTIEELFLEDKEKIGLEDNDVFSTFTRGKLGTLALAEISGANSDIYQRALANRQMENIGIPKEDEVISTDIIYRAEARSGSSILGNVEALEKNFELRIKLEGSKDSVQRVYNTTDKREVRLYQEIDEKLKALETSGFSVPLESYVKNASTIYGMSRNASWAELISAVPQNEQDYFIEFFKEKDLKKQEEILKHVSPYTKKNLKNAWGQEPNDQESNVNHVKEKHLPGPFWKGSRPEIDIKNVNVKTIQNEGMLLADFGSYESQLHDVSINDAQKINSDRFTNSLGLVSSINTILKGMGLVGVNVNVSPSSKIGVEVRANIVNTASNTQYLEKKIQDLLNF